MEFLLPQPKLHTIPCHKMKEARREKLQEERQFKANFHFWREERSFGSSMSLLYAYVGQSYLGHEKVGKLNSRVVNF